MNWAVVVCVVAALFCAEAQAVVTLSGTRLVYEGRFREVTIDVSNPGNAAVLIQAWLSDAQAEPAPENLPFVLTPHLVQLPAQGRQTLRVLYQGVGMPVDRESLLHLYVLEVPRRSEAQQQLNIAVRQRINLFYRPVGLVGDPADAAQNLLWHWQAGERGVLEVRNPTPFHVALQQLALNGVAIAEDLLLAPFSAHSLQVPQTLTAHSREGGLSFKALTDYGGQRDFCAHVSASTAFNARLHPQGANPSIGKCPP